MSRFRIARLSLVKNELYRYRPTAEECNGPI
jgi:hypothetical protein